MLAITLHILALATPPALLPGAPLQAALQAAADGGRATFTVPAGEYNFSSTPLRLQSASDLEISAAGATFWFSPGGGVALNSCARVAIRGLTIDYTPTLAQGSVLSVDRDPEAPSFTAKFDERFLAPCPDASTSSCKVGFYSPDTQQLVRNASDPAAVNIFTGKVEAAGAAGVFRVFVRVTDPDSPHGIGLAAPGMSVTVFHGSNPHSYTSTNCTNITLEDVNIFGGTGMGIVDGQGGGGSTYRRVQLTRRPLMRGVGAVALPPPHAFRLQATNEDGFHSNGNDRGPTIVDSLIAFTGDDNGNICSGMSVVLAVAATDTQRGAGGGTLSLVDVGRNLPRGRAGDYLAFYHLNTQAFQGRVALAGTPSVSHDAAAIRRMRAGFATMQAPPYSAHFVPHVQQQFAQGLPVQLQLEGPLPPAVAALWSTAVLESTDNSGARVRNTTFSDSYARAFMIKGRDASFVGNTFRRSGGIHIGPEQAWLEGDPGIENVTVEGNVFDDIGQPPAQIDAGVPRGRNIVVRNNHVTVPEGSPL